VKLRRYQQSCVDEIRAAFAHGHKRALLVSPTGSGKTVMFSYLARGVRAKNKRVYILVHRDELVEQVSETLAKFDVDHGVIAAGRPATPNPVQVCSVFSLVNRLDDYPPPDLIIPDEAHHACSGSTWDRIFKAWSDAFVLGVTATPIRLDGKPLKGSFNHMVQGPTVAELMESGDLCPYTLYAPPVAIGKLKKRMGDYVKSEAAAAMDKPQLVGNAVEHYKALAAGKRAIVFCVSLEHAENTAAAFRAAGFEAQRIDGSMDRTARRALVSAFSAGTIKVLTSCDLVSEGFDLPAIECAILMRPTASLALYLQQVGRALRPFPGKDKAIILDHAGNSGVHGLPDDDREWCLDGEETGRKGKAPPTLRLCGKCYAHAKSGVMVCAECGWAWPVESREVPETAGELEVVKEDEVKRVKLELRREVGMAKTAEALLAIEKARGYKPGWHKHVLAVRSGIRS
jgi:DNA repair protein RadD